MAAAVVMAGLGTGLALSSVAAEPTTLWGDATPARAQVDTDTAAVTLGTRFTADVSGAVVGVRYWKTAENSGTHVGTLWSADGAELASATFRSESTRGWQTVTFDTPVTVAAGEQYVVSYHAPRGRYAATQRFYGQSRTDDLSVSTGRSGVYSHGKGFPTKSWRSAQYWVDVMFRPGETGATAPGTTSGSTTTTAPATSSPSASGRPTASATPTATPAPSATTGAASPTPAPPGSTGSASAGVTPNPAPTTGSASTTTGQPGAANTGVPDGVTLSPSGGMTITQPGTVIDGQAISGSVVVQASGVVIRNSRISGNGSGNGVEVRSGSLTLQDSEITGFANGLVGSSWTAQRVDISGVTQDGVKLGSNVTLVDSWVHDLTPGKDAHADGAQLESGVREVVVQHNTIDSGNSAGSYGNSALFIAPDLGPSSPGPVVITDNWLNGGNYTVYIVDGASGRYTIGDIRLTGNRFGRHFRYGPLEVNVPVTSSGNVYADTGAAVR